MPMLTHIEISAFKQVKKKLIKKWKPFLGGQAVCECLDKYDEWFL